MYFITSDHQIDVEMMSHSWSIKLQISNKSSKKSLRVTVLCWRQNWKATSSFSCKKLSFFLLFHDTEIYKTLTPANPAATKDRKRTMGDRKVFLKHSNGANYKSVVLKPPVWTTPLSAVSFALKTAVLTVRTTQETLKHTPTVCSV